MTRRIFVPVFLSVLLLSVVAPGGAQDMPQPHAPFFTQRYRLEGESEAAALKDAMTRAIRNVIGRVYFSDYMIQALPVLDPYIENHYKDFIAHHRVWVSEVRGGKRFVDVDVVVDCTKLYADLRQKRFFYRPALRPVLYIFSSETFDGTDVEEMTGRKHLQEIINKREYRYLWQDPPTKANDPSIPASQKKEVVVPVFSPRSDPFASTNTLAVACREAQRNEVEVILAGSIQTRTTKSEDIYIDKFTYVETQCKLSLIRVDTMQVLSSVETTMPAAHRDPQEARRIATTAVLDKVAADLFTPFDKTWGKMVLRKANYRVLSIGLENDNLSVLRQVLGQIAPNAEVYTRGAYANIGVLTISWDGKVEDLMQLLRNSDYPKCLMTFEEPDGLILEII